MGDLFRDRMFAIKDELFDEDAAGRINFDDHGYSETRQAINSIIRLAHAVSITGIMLHSLVREVQHVPPPINSIWQNIDAISNPVARRVAARAYVGVQLNAVALMVLKSPLVIVILLPMAAVRLGPLALWRRVSSWGTEATVPARLRPVTDMIQAEASAAI